jgi:hypothetical protein
MALFPSLQQSIAVALLSDGDKQIRILGVSFSILRFFSRLV